MKKVRKQNKNNKNNQESNTPLVGWICPRCGKGLSPFASSCDCIYKLKPLKKQENPFPQDKFLPDYTHPQEIPYYNTPVPSYWLEWYGTPITTSINI